MTVSCFPDVVEGLARGWDQAEGMEVVLEACLGPDVHPLLPGSPTDAGGHSTPWERSRELLPANGYSALYQQCGPAVLHQPASAPRAFMCLDLTWSPVHCSPIPLRTGANGSWKLVRVKLTQKQCRVVIRSLGGGIRGAWVGVHHVGAAWPSKLRLCPRAPPGVSTCIFPVCLVEVPQGSKERVMSTGDCGRGSGCESGRQNTKLKVISPGGPR